MENSSIYDLLKILELAFCEGFSIFPGSLTVVKNSEILSIIEKIKENLPEEIITNKAKLYKTGNGNIFDYIEQLEQLINEGYGFFGFTVLNVRNINILIDKIYAELPTAIQTARSFSKS